MVQEADKEKKEWEDKNLKISSRRVKSLENIVLLR